METQLRSLLNGNQHTSGKEITSMETTRPYSPTARLLVAASPTSLLKKVSRLLLGIVLTAGLLGGADFGTIAQAQSERECVRCENGEGPREQEPRSRSSRWRLTDCVEHTLIFRELDPAHIQTFLPDGYTPFINLTTGKSVVWVSAGVCQSGSIDNGNAKPTTVVLVGPRVNPPDGADPARFHFYLADLITDSGQVHGQLTAAGVDHTYTRDISHSYTADPPIRVSSLVAGIGDGDGFSSTITTTAEQSGRPHSHLLTWYQPTRRGTVSITQDLFSITEYAGTGTLVAPPSWIGHRLLNGLTSTNRGLHGLLEVDFELSAP